ncbi:hypothetical protein BH10PSE19_BH10PSE19_20510 [soil metagenome]
MNNAAKSIYLRWLPKFQLWLLFCSVIGFITYIPAAKAELQVRGIYITQIALQNVKFITHTIERAKKVGINTFVIDFEKMTEKYKKNIKLVKDNNLHYVARIAMFPGGGTNEQVYSKVYLDRKYRLIQQALSLGAERIQLDYIRFKNTQPPSPRNAQRIFEIIKSVRQQINVPLEVDVFGISSFGESKYIGQSIPLMSKVIDGLCPMLYPSHFEPYKIHAKTPYETILTALHAMQRQLKHQIPFKVYPYFELFNYRWPLSNPQRLHYIREQIKAIIDGKSDGWYAWSASSRYDNLFKVLENSPQLAGGQPQVAIAQPQVAIAQPQGAIAQPQGATAQPQGATAQPQGATAQPQVATAQPQVAIVK